MLFRSNFTSKRPGTLSPLTSPDAAEPRQQPTACASSGTSNALVSLPKAPAPGSAVWIGVGVAVGAGVAVSAAAAAAVGGPGGSVAAAVAVAASVRVAAGVSVGVAVSAASALAAGCAAAACCNKSTAVRKAAKPTRKFLPTKICPSATSSKPGCKNTRSPALPARLLHITVSIVHHPAAKTKPRRCPGFRPHCAGEGRSSFELMRTSPPRSATVSKELISPSVRPRDLMRNGIARRLLTPSNGYTSNIMFANFPLMSFRLWR